MSSHVRPEELGLFRKLLASLKGRHTLRSHVWQSLANYTQQGFALIFGIILARILTPADFGAFGYASAVTLLLLLPATWTLAPLLLADGGRTPELFRQVLGAAWIIVAFRLIIVLAIFGWFFASRQFTFALLCLIIGIPEALREINNVQKAHLEGIGQFKPNFTVNFAQMVGAIVIATPAAIAGWGPYALALPGFATLILTFSIYQKAVGRPILAPLDAGILLREFRAGLSLWFSSVSEVAFMRFDKWFVGHYAGEAVLGHYMRAYNYAPLSHLALNSLMTNPTVSALARCETDPQRRRVFWKAAIPVFAGSILNWVLFFYFSDRIVPFVFGKQWLPAIPMFQAFASLSFCYALYYLPATVMYANRKFHLLASTSLFALAFLVVCLLSFNQKLTALDVAWLVQVATAIRGILLFWGCLRVLR